METSRIDFGFLSRVTWFLYTVAKLVESRNSLDSQLKLALILLKAVEQVEYILAFGERREVFKNLQRSFIPSEK